MLRHTKALSNPLAKRFEAKSYGMVVAINHKKKSFAQQGFQVLILPIEGSKTHGN
jgi:hypothetical protein